jgi:hypothetical protein
LNHGVDGYEHTLEDQGNRETFRVPEQAVATGFTDQKLLGEDACFQRLR